MGLWELDVNGSFVDLGDSLYFRVISSQGTGMLPISNAMQDFALQDGALDPQRVKYNPRVWSLNGRLNAEGDATKANFHSRKQALLKALNTRAGRKINDALTPLQFKYTGGSSDKVINAFFDGGLTDSTGGNDAFTQEGSVRFVSPDPFFYDTSESSDAIDTNDSSTFRVVAKRNADASVPIWDNLGPPDASGTYSEVRAFAEDDTYIYIGGLFTNFDNIASADYIVRMEKSTGTYTALGSGLNNRVYAMAIAPNGDLYVGGQFTTAGGGSANRIAVWDGSSWSALGSGLDGIVFALKFDTSGDLYVGGSFINAGGGSANRIAVWDGSSWSALGSGTGNTVTTIEILETQDDFSLYAGGLFTTAGGGSANYIAKWDGSSWSALGTGMDTNVRVIKSDDAGLLYVGGDFTTAGGTTVNYIATWNGSTWSALGAGTDNTVWNVLPSSGSVYVTGVFQNASNITADRVAIWNGSAWANFDAVFPSATNAYGLFLASNGDLYIGFDKSGTVSYAGDTTIAYSGSARAYPYFTIERSGGTSAKLVSIRNETTGAILYFDYDLLDGETLTVDLRPGSIGTTSSFFGSVPGAILPNSNSGEFYLDPGNGSGSNNNVITAFVDVAGGPTITGTIYYTAAYLSQD